ncbi:MAG TPA: hypothetical protein VIE38_06430 [Gaiellaceae bacterium]|jgi:hypothetical protein
MERLPPALAATATPRILQLLGPPPGRVLEIGFAGIHAEPLRLAGFDVFVVDRHPSAAERAGEVFAEPPAIPFDWVVAPAGADLTGIDTKRVLLVQRDGSVVG